MQQNCENSALKVPPLACTTNFVISFGSYAPLVFIGLQILQVLLAPIPGEFAGFVGGYLFGNVRGLIYSTVGLSLGSLFAFWIARGLGMHFVRRFMGQELMGKFEYIIERHGAFLAFILFLIPGTPKDSFCYLLGVSPMRVGTFLLISSLGRIPGTLLLTMQGNSVRSEHYRASFIFLGLILLLIVLAFSITLGSRKLSERQGRLLKLLSGLMMLGLGGILIVNPALLNNLVVSFVLLAGALGVSLILDAMMRKWGY